MVLEDVKVTFYAKEGRIIYLTGKQGKVYQDTKNVDLSGVWCLPQAMGISSRPIRLPTTIRRGREYFRSREIDGEQIRLTGKGMLVDVEAKTLDSQPSEDSAEREKKI